MPLKILFLSHAFSPSIGGIESSSELLAAAFVKAGHQVRLMTMTSDEAPSNFPYPVIRKPSLKESIQHHSWADIVFENNPCMRLGYPKLFFNKPSIIVLQTWISRIDGTIGLVDKIKFLWLKRASKVIAISKVIQQRCWPPAVVIGNSYNDELFAIRAQERKKDFVFVGRLVSDKGVDLALRAFSHLVFFAPTPGFEEATLTIIGEGPEYAKLKHMADGLPDPGRIIFSGSLRGNDLVNELNKHSFQFIPSRWEEPFGIVALEGIACGLIPIVSDGGGLPEAAGEAGVTFKRGELDSLIEVTKELVQSQSLQDKCRNASQKHLQLFSKETITKKIIDIVTAASSTKGSV